jgi:hypothetical protein
MCTVIHKGNQVRLPARGRRAISTDRVSLTLRCIGVGSVRRAGTVYELVATSHGRQVVTTFRLRVLTTSVRAGVTTLVVKLPLGAALALGAGKREWIHFVLTARNAVGTTVLKPRIRHLLVIR